MKLVEEGRLDLDAAMADILKNADFIYDVGTIHGYANVCKKIKEFSRDPGQASQVLSNGFWWRIRAL
jgi:CubicO group peptidase (beta-lactamase class C family)